MHKRSFLFLLIAFFLVQVAIDLAHSVTLFPFVHYGMYSEPFQRADSTEVFEVLVNGSPLLAKEHGIAEWDRIQAPLMARDKQSSTGDYAFDKEKTKEGLERVGMGKLYAAMAPRMDNDSALASQFPSWYRAYLAGLLDRPVRSLRVDRAFYRYDQGQYRLLRKEKWINL